MDLVDRIIDLALAEDIGPGDITTEPLIPPTAMGNGQILAKAPLVAAGLDLMSRVFHRLAPDTRIDCRCTDGDSVEAGTVMADIRGRMTALLMGERTALNFLQRLSGIATHVRTHIAVLGPGGPRLLDTRKTTPGLRVLEKYAVRIGGGGNHRMGLYDGILIKDNHIAACGGIAEAVARARSRASHLIRVEVEVGDMAQVREAVAVGVDVIMLDNMSTDQIRTAVAEIDGRAQVEISGNVNLDRLQSLADTGVDFISMGGLTHQARAVDISMRIVPAE